MCRRTLVSAPAGFGKTTLVIDWLRQTDIPTARLSLDETTVLHIHTDQSGIVGLTRRLHGLGITILQFQVIAAKET